MVLLCFGPLEATIRNISLTDGGMSQRWQHCSRNGLIKPLNVTESKIDHTQVNTSQNTGHVRHHWQIDSSERRSVQEREEKQEMIEAEIWPGVPIKQLQQLKGGMRKTQMNPEMRGIRSCDTHLSTVTARGERDGKMSPLSLEKVLALIGSLYPLLSIKYLTNSNTISKP